MPKISLPKNIFLRIIVIILAIPLVFYLLPFIIGGFLISFVFRRFNNKILRNSIIIALLLPTLFIGSAWAAGFTQAIVNPQSVTNSTPIPTLAPIITAKETPTPTSTPVPTLEPTATPYIQPTKIYTPAPTAKPVQQPTTQADQPVNNGAFSCNCAKTCSQMSSCSEAQYQLNSCGCSARDADHDGVACDAQCQ